MRRSHARLRREARRLFLAGEVSTNAELAARLHVKPHTIGRWRKEEDWDGLRLKVDRRAAELFVDKIASDRVTLNVRHYRLWDLLLAQLADSLKDQLRDVRDLDRVASILDRAQKGQRLAKGLSITGETEEAIRAQSQAEIRQLVDVFIEAVKENVDDEDTRDNIRKAVLSTLPEETDTGAGQSGDALLQ
jgi:hypothetical protein